MAGAEGVERHVQPHARELLERIRGLQHPMYGQRLGDFEHDLGRVQAVAPERGADPLRQPGITDAARRQVHRDTRHRQTVVAPLPDLPADQIEHPHLQRIDIATVLGRRDEVFRQQQAMLWMRPAHQRLGPAQAAITGAILGLVVDPELVPGQRRGQILLQGEFPAGAARHVRIVAGIAVLAALLGVIRGPVGSGGNRLRGLAMVGEQRPADAGRQRRVLSRRLADGFQQPAHETPATGMVGQHTGKHHKLVTADARHDIDVPGRLTHAVGHPGQQFVADAIRRRRDGPYWLLSCLKPSRSM